MMVNLTSEQIEEIADELDDEMRCFVHYRTGKTLFVPDFCSKTYCLDDQENWEEILEELEENRTDYYEFERMRSELGFEIMEDFVETVEGSALRSRLHHALSSPRPFSHFNREIHASDEYRKRWFVFKKQRMIAFVTKQIEKHLK